MSAPQPPPDVRARLEAILPKRKVPTREQHRLRSIVLLAASLLPALYGLAVHGIHAGKRPVGYIVFFAVAWIGTAAAAGAYVLVPPKTTLGRSRGRLLALAVALPVALLGAALAANALFPEALAGSQERWAMNAHCVKVALLLSIAPLAAFLYVFRRSDPVRPSITGAALGAIASSWGGAILAVQCPNPEPVHVAIAHVLPVIVGAIVGAVLGARVVAVRWIYADR